MIKKIITVISLMTLSQINCAYAVEKYPEIDENKRRILNFSFVSQEDKWWNKYIDSKSTDIVKYVHDLATKNPEAACWFFITGGKYGFSQREASSEELILLIDIANKIKSSLSLSDQMIEWASDSPLGNYHLDFIYPKIDKQEAYKSFIQLEDAWYNKVKIFRKKIESCFSSLDIQKVDEDKIYSMSVFTISPLLQPFFDEQNKEKENHYFWKNKKNEEKRIISREKLCEKIMKDEGYKELIKEKRRINRYESVLNTSKKYIKKSFDREVWRYMTIYPLFYVNTIIKKMEQRLNEVLSVYEEISRKARI